MTDNPQETGKPARRYGRRAMVGAAATGALVAGAAGAVGGRLTADTGPRMTAAPADGARFAGKVVLITGATSGIGRAAAQAFAAEGAKVAFCGRREDRGKQVEQEIRAAGHEATYLRADVRVEDQVRRFVDSTASRYGRLDVVFSNAGIHGVRKLHEVPTAEWDDIQTTNVRGAFFTLKHSIPHLLKAGGGSIVITASINSLAVRQGFASYGASKHALLGLMQAAALDYGADGIRVNAVLPGIVDTEMVRKVAGIDAPDSVYRAGIAVVARSRAPAAGRIGKPEEVAAFVVDLASDRYPFMTGSAQVIDGGATAMLP